MYKFIFLTFAFLSWAFYEMSGGAEFEPAQPVAKAEPAAKPTTAKDTPVVKAAVAPEPAAQSVPEVTRAAYTAPSYSLGKPAEEELAAVDPAVLASFSNALTGEPVVEDSAVAEQIALDLRQVTGNRVNMRNGPGTDYSIVSRLQRGDSVEVLSEPGNGWLKLRVADTGRIGWMADFLVSSAN